MIYRATYGFVSIRFLLRIYYELVKHHVKGCKSRWKNDFIRETYGLVAIGCGHRVAFKTHYEEQCEECTM